MRTRATNRQIYQANVFPTNGVLDNFNRADSSVTVGPNWTAYETVGGNSGNEGISSNQLYNPFGSFSNYTMMYWNGATFGPDCEAYMSIPTLPGDSSNDKPIVFARLTHLTPLGTFNGYGVTYFDSNGGIFLTRVDSGTTTQISSTIGQSQTAGDKIGISCVGNKINLWYYTSGAWTLKTTVTDTTYATAGNIGWYIPGNTQNGRYDDFGGGSLKTPVKAVGRTRAVGRVLHP